MSGLLVGILLSTSLAGLFSNLFHWKVVYAISGILMLLLAYTLKPPTLCHAYETELWTNFCFHGSAFKAGKATLLRALTGAFAFASVSILYSTIALLLTSAHHLPDLFIGLVPLVGIFGALSTRYIGKYADQGYTRLLTWMGCGPIFNKLDLFLFRTNSTFSLCYWFAFISIGTCPCPHQQPKYYFPFTSRC